MHKLADFGLTPVAASEIEFYLHGSHERDLAAFWQDVASAAARADIALFNMEKERGHEQHEVSLAIAAPEKTARDTAAIKTIIEQAATRAALRADFAAKPFADQPGSGLHIHIHLEDALGRNVFYKDDHTMSDTLRFSIGGLLAMMQKDMDIFAPNPESLLRFTAGSNAPLTLSWGANNRTTAIRLPDSAHDKKRIEHRVAGSDADPQKVMEALLAAMYFGLKERIEPGAQIYGDAALAHYNLPKLISA